MSFDPPSELVMNLFKDAAHIFIGYVFTRWWFDRFGPDCFDYGVGKSYLLWTGVVLSLLELIVGVATAVEH